MAPSGMIAFPIWIGPPTGGAGIDDPAASDWFVMAHLGFFFFLFTCLGFCVWQIWKRTVRPEPHIRLLIEMEADERQAEVGKREGLSEKSLDRDPWERAPDWWQKST